MRSFHVGLLQWLAFFKGHARSAISKAKHEFIVLTIRVFLYDREFALKPITKSCAFNPSVESKDERMLLLLTTVSFWIAKNVPFLS